jgi:hypothetical protein
MAYPGKYDINYYKGDTHEFKIYPKNNDGSQFDLTDYEILSFTISDQRGQSLSTDYISAYVAKVDDTHILCAIRPEDGNLLVPGTAYVYDVEIEHPQLPYSKIHTLLTGNITVTDQVTPARVAPNSPTNLIQVVGTEDDTTITVSWTEPDVGPPITGYKIYVATNPLSIEQAIATKQLVATTTTPSVTSYLITNSDLDPLTALIPGAFYGIGVYAYNDAGESATPAINVISTEVGS